MGAFIHSFVRTTGAASNGATLVNAKPEGLVASVICFHARLVKVKNVSVGISERQALSNLIRFSRSRDPSMKYDSLSILMSPVDVSDGLARLEHCLDAPPFSAVSGCRSGNRFKRLLSCPGLGKLLEWFLPFLATVASSDAEDRRLAKMAERCVCKQYTRITSRPIPRQL